MTNAGEVMILDLFKLDGRVALVTGARRGLGQAMALGLAEADGGHIRPHTDAHPSFHAGHRIHVPITTNRRVRFMIEGRPHRMEVGQAYEINNQKTHSVANRGDEDRITFIFDYVPPSELGRTSQTAA